MTPTTAHCATALFAIAAQAAVAAPAPAPPADVAESQVRSLDRRLVGALAAGEAMFVEASTSQDFRMIGNNGAHVDRAAFLATLVKPLAVDGASANDDARVRVFSSVALVHGTIGSADSAPRLRYTHVFHWDGARWLMVGAQHTALRAGVAKAIVSEAAPQHARWQGADPSGDEPDVLRRLNELYVKAYRDADVAWYDAHLASDYVVTNGDGSFSDRGSALVAFARPSFATHFRTFPVGNVTIRRFADVALIEAENAYEMKDGRTGISRYTDIWHKADGGWRCLSAHITIFKSPN